MWCTIGGREPGVDETAEKQIPDQIFERRCRAFEKDTLGHLISA
jgi:hypothetical protein